MNYGLKIKAGSIQNLTDARYFAAMGVDYLGIDLDSLDHPVVEFLDISQWVEVPNLIAESSKMTDEQWEDFRGFVELKWVQKDVCLNHVSDNSSYVVIEAKSWSEIESFSNREDSQSLIVDITTLDPKNLQKEVLEQFHAIQFRGSEEEKLGFKSYDQLDVLFEWLEE